MEAPGSEAFIFFNFDAVQRVAGLDELSQTLIDLFGTEERAQRVVMALAECHTPTQKEEVIITEYRRALVEDVGTPYVTVFRVEYEHRRATSHFFLHATKHPLGFSIMKDVMWLKPSAVYWSTEFILGSCDHEVSASAAVMMAPVHVSLPTSAEPQMASHCSEKTNPLPVARSTGGMK